MKLRNWSIFFFISIASVIYSQDYYWYKNEKIFLEEGNMFYVVYYDDSKADQYFAKILKKNTDQKGQLIKSGIISDKKKSNIHHLLYQARSYRMLRDTTNLFITENFYVRLKDSKDTLLLRDFAQRYCVEIVRKGSLSCWYILRCPLPSQYNALQMANIFYESGLFSAAEPEFIHSAIKTCVNDTYFNQQWNLNNTGQYDITFTGVDLNYCEAHAITNGEGYVIIAVVDDGIKISHPDLNVSSISFDAHTLTSPSKIYGNHGTSCAGVIGAQSNNNVGVAGIASGCQTMSISWDEEWTPIQNIADGIKFAWKNGASIISNSWKCYPNDYLGDQIDSALYYGREGKGCVVVFATGNINLPTVLYPANYNLDIIAVGAITPSMARKDTWDLYEEPNIEWWGSNYGEALDVVAPGIFVPTTDTIGYRQDFRGTSAACPHVAAVAGLILSVNQNLTQQEVGYIISATAQKVGNYNYTDTLNHPYGTWHREMGYGLVDAYAAVQMALNRYVQDTIYGSGNSILEAPHSIYAGRNVTAFKPQGAVVIPAGSNVHYLAGDTIHLEPGFQVNLGAHFYAEVGEMSQPNAMRKREENNLRGDEKDDYGVKETKTLFKKSSDSKKVYRDGQLFIIHGDGVYNSQGNRVQ